MYQLTSFEMKRNTCIILLAFILSMNGTDLMAYDFAAKNKDGVTIYYEYTNDGKELGVTNDAPAYKDEGKCYSGSVVIPEEVTYMNRTRKVTSINSQAFYKCENLTSVSVPGSVKEIGSLAFSGCIKLTKITLPSSLTKIGEKAFYGCKTCYL